VDLATEVDVSGIDFARRLWNVSRCGHPSCRGFSTTIRGHYAAARESFGQTAFSQIHAMS
jgi:hypothetical protein